ncbi:MAG TPA: DUF3108 domain-containing protein, partial [Cyclobacteriaceae bacterium]|nr:DUF3108 domain-containing protein [Cyclobacteriaceae bacterium]
MKALLKSVALILLFGAFTMSGDSEFVTLKNTSFGKGEVLSYRVNFGFFTVGKASTVIDNKVFMMNGRPSYKVDAFGETSGMVSWITKVNDQWGAYIDTA